MSEMLERCARVIYEGRNGLGATPWFRRDARHKEPYYNDARAVLAALAEPTAEMVEAGRDKLDETQGVWAEPAYIAAMFRAMLSKAKSE